MKPTILFLSMLFAAFSLLGQQDDREAARAEVEKHRQETARAAQVFLDQERSVEERIKAITPYAYVYEDKQVEGFKVIVRAQREDPKLRAVALSRIYAPAARDEKFQVDMRKLLVDPQTPQPLRDEVLQMIGSLSLSVMPGILEEYYVLSEDADERYREFAVSKLLMYGDARTQQRLIEDLRSGRKPLFSPAKTIELLSWAPKKDFFPVVYEVFQKTDDQSTRLMAIQVLGPYQPAREALIEVSRNAKEDEALREVALLSLYSGDRENTISYVQPLLADRFTSDRLKGIAIQMALDVRQSMAVRRGGSLADVGSGRKQSKASGIRQADDFDRLVRSIAEGKGVDRSEELAEIAQRYLLLVRPPFDR